MKEVKNIIDISLPIHEGATVYPGNPEVTITEKPGATSVHSEISFGSHTGTHIDAPRHVFKDGLGIDKMSLDAFFGPCNVFDFSEIKEAILVSDLEKKNIQKGDRILLKTHNSVRGFDSFYDDYVYLDGDAAEYLAEKEVKLVGIDYFSVKKRGGSDNRPHTALLEKNIPIIEAVNLKDVAEGEYMLSAFPLKITDGDGSPARVVLMNG